MDILPRRKITGYSAALLPFRADGAIDWDGFCAHVARTAAAGLVPAVNMDTGFGNLIDEQTRVDVLRRTRDTIPGQLFTAGAFVPSQAGDSFAPDAYYRQFDQIQAYRRHPDHLSILRADPPAHGSTHCRLRRFRTPRSAVHCL